MRILLLVIVCLSFVGKIMAQNNECFDKLLQRGDEAFELHDYNKAVQRWQAAIDNCNPDYNQKNTLNVRIQKAQEAVKKPDQTPETHFEYEPEMVEVKGGTFAMGSTNGDEDEKPVHNVTLSSFSIGKTEVTQAQWEAIMGNNPSVFKQGNNYPVENVNWGDIQVYLQKLNAKTSKNYRLPTEAEWEFAARGGNNSKNYAFSGSNTLSDVGWYTENSGAKTHNVGKKKANELGIYDMSGNVWEWCGDWYDEYYYESSPVQNPKGASNGRYRVLRGGPWSADAGSCRAANRRRFDYDYLDFNSLGFRLAR